MTETSDGPVLVIGAGGHAKVVIEALRAIGRTVGGLLAPMPLGSRVLDVPVVGGDADLARLRAEGFAAAALGIGDNRRRAALAEQLRAFGFALPVIAHSSAWVSPTCRIGAGTVVLPKAVLSTETTIGGAVIINSGAIVEHDGVVGDAAHVCPGCAIAGNVRIGARTLVGVGTSIRPGIVIGSDAVIGAGSVVVSDVADGAMVMGSPARARS